MRELWLSLCPLRFQRAQQLQPCESSGAIIDGSSKDYPQVFLDGTSGHASSSCGVGRGEAADPGFRHSPSNVGPVSCADNSGGPVDGLLTGSDGRFAASRRIRHKRFFRQSSPSSRTCHTPRPVLRLGAESHGSSDVSNNHGGPVPSGAPRGGDQRDQVFGALRRIWKTERARPGAVPADDSPGLLDGREPGSFEGHAGLAHCLHRAGRLGLRQIRGGSDPDLAGGCALRCVHEPPIGVDFKGKSFRTFVRSQVGHHSDSLSKGAGHHYGKAHRAAQPFRRRCLIFDNCGKSTSGQAQSKAKGRGKRKGSAAAEPDHGGGGTIDSLDPSEALQLLRAKATFADWSICLPRWVLRTRTDFAWHLARSFSVRWRSTSTSTAVFPLPLPHPGCYDGGGPKLSAKRLAVLARKRVVHILTLLLNRLYLGRFATSDELGRQPSRSQRACFARLHGFVAACGSRLESFDVAPGRSGPELIACLDRLEQFALHADLPTVGYGDHVPLKFPGQRRYEDETKDSHPELRPYRSLCVDRLKITGRGAWPLADYLESDLWLPFVEPRSLLHGLDTSEAAAPSFAGESRSEYLKLAQRWDALGLLRLRPSPLVDGHVCKVFGAFKNSEADRQIGDRRIPNSREFSAGGPSRHLPTGPMLLGILADRGKVVRGSLTDRRDFYHQAAVTRERSRTNLTPFAFSRFELAGLRATKDYDEWAASLKKRPREAIGDFLHGGGPELPTDGADLFPGFAALYQGDHLGVEYALESHQNLLRSEDLLHPERRLQGHAPVPLRLPFEGLIIDDYFAIGASSRTTPKEDTDVFKLLAKARDAYEKHCLPGSPEKDVIADDLFKAAGAEVDSRSATTASGLVLVGAPLAKRLGLSVISLRAAALPVISSKLASRLSGSWVSTLLYRRCVSSVVKDFFSLAALHDETEQVFKLPRSCASELTILSCLVPLIVSDVSAPVSRTVYATDASLQKGAIVKTDVPLDVAKCLWLDGDRKGNYTKLDNGFRAALKSIEEYDDSLDEQLADVLRPGVCPEKPPLFRFDFVEVCGGAGKVSKELALRGYVIAPILDLSFSLQYNLVNIDLLNWLVYMLSNNYIRSAMCEPPCTTFSPAAHPACRSYDCPLGWDRSTPKVHLGNILAFRNLVVIYVCHRHQRPGCLEQSRLSKMAWLSAWRWLLSIGCQESVVASCNFNSPRRKEFRLLLTGLDPDAMTRKCPGGHRHVQIQGSLTKPSAVYTDALAVHFAECFVKALQKLPKDEAPESGCCQPIESVLVNDLLRSFTWEVERDWFFKTKVHINLLETSVVVSLTKQLLVESPGFRLCVLLDSAVAKGALAKGRSSSRGLQPLLQKAAACQLAGNLYLSHSYAPTKLNVADDPTREQDLREPSRFKLLDFLECSEMRELHWKLATRPTANWIRLTAFLVILRPAEASHGIHLDILPSWLPFIPGYALAAQAWIFAFHPISLVILFFGLCWIFLAGPPWIFSKTSPGKPSRPPNNRNVHLGTRFRYFPWLLIFASCFSSAMAPLAPLTAAEAERARKRVHIELGRDRVMRKQTRENRVRLLAAFEAWLLEECGIAWTDVLSRKPLDAEEICHWVCLYGRQLHAAGKSYSIYAETINGITALRPILKRQMTAAWDLAFAWLVDEPHQHHPALPLSIMLAMTCLALIWGWPLEAAIFSMTWTGLLRIGEVITAVKKDLILPWESAPGIEYILLRISEPKTRGKGARHQSAKIEPEDIVRLVSSVFQRHSPSQRLWPFSAQTLRRRFNLLLKGLGLQTKPENGVRPYDLGSLRPGGATFLLNKTEDCSLLQRRGRWLSYKVMTIYLQEISVATAEMTLSETSRVMIQQLNSIFPEVLDTAVSYISWQLPPQIWYLLFRGHHRVWREKVLGLNACFWGTVANKMQWCQQTTPQLLAEKEWNLLDT